MAKKNANGKGSRPRRKPDGRWEARHWSDGGDAPVSAPTDVTVAEFLARYEDAATYATKRRSFETYHSIAKVHFLPAFGTIRLKNLTREHVQRMYSRKRASGLSAARVRRIHGVLSSVLNRVFGWGLIERNVREHVSPPRVPAPEIRPLDRDEANRFLKAAESDRYHALCVLGLTPGIRLGEIAACSGPTWTWTSACCACDGRLSPATA